MQPKQFLKNFALLVIAIGSFQRTFASHNEEENATRLRQEIEFKEPIKHQTRSFSILKDEDNTHKIVLPVSRGFDQSGTELCWAYSFLNALESMYLVSHPGGNIELSRGAMQYITIEDRINLKIANPEEKISERGTSPDAAYLIKNFGIVQFSDYHDVMRDASYTSMLDSIFTASTPLEQNAIAKATLPIFFGEKIPELTNFEGLTQSAIEFGNSLLGKGNWVSYAISKDDSSYLAPDPDKDARRGAITHYIPKAQLIEKMRSSLTRGIPVLYSNIAHLVLIYGAEYTKTGEPIKFYIKDSYEPKFLYQSDATKTLEKLGEITILE